MTTRFSATAADSSFPQRLRREPEICSFVEAVGPLSGALDHLPPAVAIVGTRSPPEVALRYTRWFASQLALRGVLIVSGGAHGIDAAAHEGALDVGGPTIAVLPAGVDNIYPEPHAPLFQRIAATGALVAIQPRGSDIHGFSFDRRNAVIAALADHVVITCAPLKSGARSTAKHARTMGIRLWVVPGAPWDAATEGQARECVFTDAARLTSPDPILRALGRPGLRERSFLRWDEGAKQRIERTLEQGQTKLIPRPVKSAPKQRPAPQRAVAASIPPLDAPTRRPSPREWLQTDESILPSGDERNVVEALQRGPLGIDELVLLTGLGVASLRGLLLTWTVEGVVREGPAGLFRLANR